LFLHVYLKKKALLPEVIIPMPLHPSRTRERGFNQSVEMGKILSKKLNIPLDTKSCQRIKKTKVQRLLSKKARTENMRKAFSVALRSSYRHVVILDDVFTTGASIDSLAKQLKQAGILKIEVWCIARASLS
jgi:ComF family protein